MESSTVQDVVHETAQQLYFEIENNAAGTSSFNVIYITDDAGYNKVSLQIQLTSGHTVLTPGTIPVPPATPTQGTTFYVDLSALKMSQDVWRRLTLSAAGWEFRTFPDQGVFGMTPTKPITFESGTGGVITVTVDGIEVPAPLGTPNVSLYGLYYNVPGIAGTYTSFSVALQNPPVGDLNLLDVVAFLLDGNGIVNSPTAQLVARNKFGLQLSSTGTTNPNAGEDTVLTVSFVYGAPHDPDGYGALTAVDNATQIVARKGLNADQWTVTGHTDVQHPYWTLRPPNGAPIVGTGSQSIVEVLFDSVVTTYQPGPTAMLVSWSGVPGYRDGTTTLVLNKVAHARITSFEVSPNPSYFTNGSAEVTASWTTSGAQSLTLTQNYRSTPVTGRTRLPVTLRAESTVLTLQATGAPGTVANVEYKSVTAIALPVINSFTGTPTEIFSGSSSHSADFAWAVDSSDGVILTSTGGAFHNQSGAAVGSAPTTIFRPQMVTLAPVTVADRVTLTRNLVVSAFTPTPTSYPQSGASGAVAVSPTGPYLLLGGNDGVTALDTVAYRTDGSVSTGRRASAIAISADGSMVAVANGDASLSIFTASVGAGGRPAFGTPQTVTLPGTPHALVLTPDAGRLFVTVDDPAGKPGQVVALVRRQQEYTSDGHATVGVGPRGITFDSAGSRLFVANSGDGTISTIGLTVDGRLGNVTPHPVPGGPTGIAAAPGGQQLLVSCAVANTVVALDPDHLDTGKVLNVGRTPGQLAVTPNGAYAFVVNTGDGTVTLIDCDGVPSSAAVVGDPIPVGAGATSIAVSADGLQVPVATGAGLTVITLDTYAARGCVPIMVQPTSVETSTDGGVVFTWHDASIPANANVPGIMVYNTTTTNTFEVMADKYVLRCVTSGDPTQKLAVAVAKDDPQLYLIDEQFDVIPVSLALPTGATPVALGISADGCTIWDVVIDPAGVLFLVVLRASGGESDAVWDQVGQPLELYQVDKHSRQLLRATPDGSTLLLVDTATGTVHALTRTADGYALSPKTIACGTGALDLAVLPDASTAYVLTTGAGHQSITVIDLPSLGSRVVAIPETYVAMRALRPSPDGRRLFATDSSAGAVRMLDPVSLRIVQTIPLGTDADPVYGALGIAVAPDGAAVYAVGTTSQVLAIVEQIQMGLGDPAPHGRPAAVSESSALFMRHALDDSPSSPSSGWSASPDVIPYGTGIAQDLNQFVTAEGYMHDFVADVPLGAPNYVYVRGLNTTGAEVTSRVYFYYTKGSLALWPANWTSAFVQVNNKNQNWVDVTAPPVSAKSNGVGVGQVPLVWTPPPLDPSADHYCVIGWVVNGPDPQPPDFSKYANFTEFQQLIDFIQAHHNMAWRNTIDVLSKPPNSTYSTLLPIGAGGADVYLQINFPNVPMDATFSVNLQGNTAENTLALENACVGDYRGGYSPSNNPLPFPPRAYQTSLQVSLYEGDTKFPDTARIKIVVGEPEPPSLLRETLANGLRQSVRSFGGFRIFVVGSTFYNLRFNDPKARRGQGAAR